MPKPTPDECIGLLNLVGGNAKHKEVYDHIKNIVNAHETLTKALQRIVDINGSIGAPRAVIAEFKAIALQALADSEGGH